MGEKRISTLLIRVDLSCEKCYNKIRQVLCIYDCQIISKTFDKKNNLVIVTGYFCPGRFSKKLCCKAGKAIISIEEKKDEPEPPPPAPEPVSESPPVVVVVEETPPPPPAPEPEPAPPAPEPEPAPVITPKEPELQPQPPPQMVVPFFIPTYPPPQYGGCCGPCSEGYGGGPCYEGYGMPVVPPPPRPPPQYGGCCGPCSEGYGGGPCYEGYGMPVVPPPPRRPRYEYDYYGQVVQPPCSCGCGGNRRCSTPCDYICEEDPTKCSIM